MSSSHQLRNSCQQTSGNKFQWWPVQAPVAALTEDDRKFQNLFQKATEQSGGHVGFQARPLPADPAGGGMWTNKFSNIRTSFESRPSSTTTTSTQSRSRRSSADLVDPVRKYGQFADDFRHIRPIAISTDETGRSSKNQSSTNLKRLINKQSTSGWTNPFIRQNRKNLESRCGCTSRRRRRNPSTCAWLDNRRLRKQTCPSEVRQSTQRHVRSGRMKKSSTSGWPSSHRPRPTVFL